ncbi:hypothetical protein [Arthrobacter sp. TWP1-1]|uniref:hypothetical protein n=1 Tax=Arthrobacter sp. TWP1-1 TaxID=2804568 RepID=UPI003CE85CC1
MDLDQLGKLLAGIAGLLAVGVTITLAARKATNRESIAHRRASGALSLLKAWDETELGGEDHGDVRARQTLRRELVEQAFRSTQIYVSSTKPTFVSYWQPFLILVVSVFWFWNYIQSTETPNPDNPWHVAAVLGVPLVLIFLVIFIVMRVSQHHDDERALKKSRNRTAIYVKAKAKAKQSMQEKRNKALVSAGSQRGQTEEEG